jgi:hypothetical protein
MRGVGWKADVTSRDPTSDAAQTLLRDPAWHVQKCATAIFDMSLRVGLGPAKHAKRRQME